MKTSKEMKGKRVENSKSLKEIIIEQYEKDGYTYNRELDSLESENDVLTSDFIDSIIKLRQDNNSCNKSAIICLNINRLVSDWKVKCVFPNTCLVDDADYFDAYDFIDVDGFRDHKFYTCIEYKDSIFESLDDHSRLIVNLILTDIESGLWSVDLRVRYVQALLRYLSKLMGIDLVEKIMENRKNIKEFSKSTKIPDMNDINLEG